MLIKEMKYCYDDISIVPSIKTNIEHRSDCDPYIDTFGKKSLPIFTAPMSTVVNEDNFSLFEDNGIIPILPRNIEFSKRIEYLKKGKWVAVGLQEFEDLFLNEHWNFDKYPNVNVLIDIANGHMTKLHNLIYDAKTEYNWNVGFKIMAGNIANPRTYHELAIAGCDYVRVGIGGGEGCLTASNTGVYYGYASLIYETYLIKKELEHCTMNTPYIIADGGIKNYCDVMKAIGVLGADFVMIGGLFSRLIESAAPTFYYDLDGCINEINPFEHSIIVESNNSFNIDGEYTVNNLHKVFYGMASRKGQEDINGEKKKTSEGIEKILDCTTNLKKWSENMAEYMQSAMSYTNCYYIWEFNPENVDGIIISQQTKQSINK